jgi:hypothetical protein
LRIGVHARRGALRLAADHHCGVLTAPVEGCVVAHQISVAARWCRDVRHVVNVAGTAAALRALAAIVVVAVVMVRLRRRLWVLVRPLEVVRCLLLLLLVVRRGDLPTRGRTRCTVGLPIAHRGRAATERRVGVRVPPLSGQVRVRVLWRAAGGRGALVVSRL